MIDDLLTNDFDCFFAAWWSETMQDKNLFRHL